MSEIEMINKAAEEWDNALLPLLKTDLQKNRYTALKKIAIKCIKEDLEKESGKYSIEELIGFSTLTLASITVNRIL